MAEKPDPVDVHVGKRIRLRRTLLGMSQQKVGAALGLTFQQVQKYESGVNRVGASRLYQIARVLNVPVSFFFEGAPAGANPGGGSDEAAAAPREELRWRREALELMRAYQRISSEAVRKRVLDLVRVCGG